MFLPRKFLPVAAVGAWIALVAVGFAALEQYAATAGPAGSATPRAAQFLARQQKPGRALVVMAVHPQCPCTRASLAELGDLLARSHGACDALLLEYRPREPQSDWPETAPMRELGGVLVTVVADPDGELARAFGAETSGHVIFADASGAIQFQGGITIARGHRGLAPAQSAILASIGGHRTELCGAPVFGCALENSCPPKSEP